MLFIGDISKLIGHLLINIRSIKQNRWRRNNENSIQLINIWSFLYLNQWETWWVAISACIIMGVLLCSGYFRYKIGILEELCLKVGALNISFKSPWRTELQKDVESWNID